MRVNRFASLALLLTTAVCIQSRAQYVNLNISAQAGYDNTISTSSVDANGNPNFLSGAATTLTISGSPTPLVLMIAGVYEVLNTSATLTLSTAGEYFIYAVQDLSNTTLGNMDFGSTTLPPVYQYVAPPCSTTASPQIWFDLSTNLMKTCVSGGSFTAQPLIVIGVADVNSGLVIDQVLCEPYRLNPYRRVELFGTGVDGSIVTGATIDGWKQLASLYLSGTTTLTPSQWIATAQTPGLILFSQNPVMILNGAKVSGDGLGITGLTGSTGIGSLGGNGGCGGAGGGGGGSASGNGGGLGGGRTSWLAPWSPTGAGSAGVGGGSSTAGGPGQPETISATTPIFPNEREIMSILCIGAAGAGGGGDGTNTGGAGGNGGGIVIIRAPSILIGSGSSVTANGTAGGGNTVGNIGGGGGGGGGTAILQAFFVNQNGTFLASGGAHGNGHGGTSKAGGAGGAGLFASVKLQ
jgi:hypothetical protein